MQRVLKELVLLTCMVCFPIAAVAQVEARVWPDVESWRQELGEGPTSSWYQIVWDETSFQPGSELHDQWVPYYYFHGVWFRKTAGPPSLIYDPPRLNPDTRLTETDQVSFTFGEPCYGCPGGIWYEPVGCFGVHVETSSPLQAQVFDTNEQLLGEWTIMPGTDGIWGVLAEDHILGELVLTETHPASVWHLELPIVIGAPVPEPATLSLLAIGGMALIRRKRK